MKHGSRALALSRSSLGGKRGAWPASALTSTPPHARTKPPRSVAAAGTRSLHHPPHHHYYHYSYSRLCTRPPSASASASVQHLLCASSSASHPSAVLSSVSPATRRATLFTSRTAVSVAEVAMAHPYTFPTGKMHRLSDDSRTPLVLISCGSFSPITYLHLRMFEMCKDWVKENTSFEVVAGYLSPVSDAYEKQGLALASHRIEMCQLAAAESSWIMVDDWEAIKPEYTRTALVLDHFREEINDVRGGVETSSGARVSAKVALMSGADLIQTMSNPGVWAEEDLEHILGRYGAFIIERNGTDMDKALESLQRWRDQIYPIPQLIQNDVSSTKIRNFLRKDMSIRYLIPEPALKYIDQHNLFKEEAATDGKNSRPGSSQLSHNGNLINGA